MIGSDVIFVTFTVIGSNSMFVTSTVIDSDADLERREPALRCIVKRNPRNNHWGEMKLYLESQVRSRWPIVIVGVTLLVTRPPIATAPCH